MSGVLQQPVNPVVMTKYRWVICGMLFAATAINYIDRQILGVLKPTLQNELGWTETDYANIIFWFQAAYALSYVLYGRVIDKIGARLGYASAVAIWTLAHIGHAFARAVPGFILARMGLGVGEAGNFPGGLKAVTEWFPKKERAFAVGIFNAGANVGAIITPLIVPAITIAYGWRAAFIITGLFGIVWLVAWLLIYRSPREHKKISSSELAHIESDPADKGEQTSWFKLLRRKETWAFSAAKFLTDPVWWMFLFWLPDFLVKQYSLDLKTFGPPLIVIYLLSDVGSIAGGWLSSRLMSRGYSMNASRKITLLVCAVLILPVAFATYAENMWLAVGIIGLAAAAHQGFSANLLTMPSDLFPRKSVGSVIGIGGMMGAIGGMLMAKYVGWVLDKIGSYTPIFAGAATLYLVALLLIHLITPRYKPIE